MSPEDEDIIERIGEAVGMAHGGWDMVKPEDLLAAFRAELVFPERERCARLCEEEAKRNESVAEILMQSQGPDAASARRWRASDCRVLALRILQG